MSPSPLFTTVSCVHPPAPLALLPRPHAPRAACAQGLSERCGGGGALPVGSKGEPHRLREASRAWRNTEENNHVVQTRWIRHHLSRVFDPEYGQGILVLISDTAGSTLAPCAAKQASDTSSAAGNQISKLAVSIRICKRSSCLDTTRICSQCQTQYRQRANLEGLDMCSVP